MKYATTASGLLGGALSKSSRQCLSSRFDGPLVLYEVHRGLGVVRPGSLVLVVPCGDHCGVVPALTAARKRPSPLVGGGFNTAMPCPLCTNKQLFTYYVRGVLIIMMRLANLICFQKY